MAGPHLINLDAGKKQPRTAVEGGALTLAYRMVCEESTKRRRSMRRNEPQSEERLERIQHGAQWHAALVPALRRQARRYVARVHRIREMPTESIPSIAQRHSAVAVL